MLKKKKNRLTSSAGETDSAGAFLLFKPRFKNKKKRNKTERRQYHDSPRECVSRKRARRNRREDFVARATVAHKSSSPSFQPSSREYHITRGCSDDVPDDEETNNKHTHRDKRERKQKENDKKKHTRYKYDPWPGALVKPDVTYIVSQILSNISRIEARYLFDRGGSIIFARGIFAGRCEEGGDGAQSFLLRDTRNIEFSRGNKFPRTARGRTREQAPSPPFTRECVDCDSLHSLV